MINTKSTFLGNGIWGCRVFYDNDLLAECTVDSQDKIGPAMEGMIGIFNRHGENRETGETKNSKSRFYPNDIKFYRIPKELSF